jgi:hypothetical protein
MMLPAFLLALIVCLNFLFMAGSILYVFAMRGTEVIFVFFFTGDYTISIFFEYILLKMHLSRLCCS